MGCFETMQNYIGHTTGTPDEIVNIEDAFTMSPKTPKAQVAKMDIFDEKVLRDCVISNIRTQHQDCQGGLTRKTWIKLLEFLGKDFNNGSDTIKTYIQVFIHFTKMSIDEDTSKKYGFTGMGKMEFYDLMLSNFVAGALEYITEDIMIKVMTMEKATKLKKRLLSQPILEAILKNISALELPSAVHSIDINYISSKISSGCIYEMNFRPFDILRGAALQDGIMICSKNVAGLSNTMNHDADLLTLASHQFSHHVVRLIFDDLNFSSPGKNGASNYPRFHCCTIPQPLEIGRNTQLVLFDGIQPNWFVSGVQAAATFLDRIDSNFSPLPVISKDEYKKLALSERPPTPFFGIDIKPELILME